MADTRSSGSLGREPAIDLNEPVELAEYSVDWPIEAEREIGRVIRALDLLGIRSPVEHIGSTAIPGMQAKPIIDLQVGVEGRVFIAVAKRLVEKAGYEDAGEAGVAGRRYLRKRGSVSFNLHVVQFGGPIWKANLAFRDYLRAFPAEAEEYARAKRGAMKIGKRLLSYSIEKAEAMARLMDKANRWSKGRHIGFR